MDDDLAQRLMYEALALADEAMAQGEVPIAAVIARGDGKIVGWGWNQANAKRDKTAHAELDAFRDAAGRYPLDAKDLIMVSTLEPCVMCFGAALLCGVREIVYALPAPADAGFGRVAKPESPESTWPRVTARVLERESRERFERWLREHDEAGPQRDYVDQLLKLQTAT
jgi:tRNA(Arg) A34 adenosine deaminase TadA